MKKYYIITDEYKDVYLKFACDNNIVLVCCPRAIDCYGKLLELDDLRILYAIIDVCDGVFVADGYKENAKSKALLTYAKSLGKEVRFESKQWGLRKEEQDV